MCKLHKEKEKVALEYSSCHLRDNSSILVNAAKPQSTAMTNSAITIKAPINSNGGKWRQIKGAIFKKLIPSPLHHNVCYDPTLKKKNLKKTPILLQVRNEMK